MPVEIAKINLNIILPGQIIKLKTAEKVKIIAIKEKRNCLDKLLFFSMFLFLITK